MDKINWAAEPDVHRLRKLHEALASNLPEAIPGLKELAEEGSGMSAFYLADFYMNGKKASDEALALRWYAAAHDRGVVQASYMLGRLYYKQGDLDKAFEVFSAGAEKSYLPAMYRTAKMYQAGEGVPESLPDCIRLLEQAEAAGHVYSRRDLAGLMLSGKLGAASVARGAVMLAKVGTDIAGMIGEAAKGRTVFDERILA